MYLFEESYKKLNKEQRAAVDAIEGPVMVVAGPGTGKTQILSLRIANILKKTDTKPEQILALTFTEAAAYNMRRRLAQLVGSVAYRVTINTFHGFCNDVIKKYPEDFPRIIGSKGITEVEQVSIIEKIIEEGSFVLLKPFGDRFLYVRDILKSISELKREGISCTQFSELVIKEKREFTTIPDLYHVKGAHKGKMKGEYQKYERKILKNEELATIYTAYERALTERKQYDFNDMILEVLKTLLVNTTLLQMLQEEHQYILVDEHQDTNNAQNKIIEQIMSYHENPNLFVVGDEKQAIFRFQGASLENFNYFQKIYPTAKLITLTENYRSTQTVLDTAHRLIPGRVPLTKNVSHTEKAIQIGEFETEASERYFVAHDIKKKIDTGVPASEIAILYRNNKDAFPIARDLARLGVSCVIESDEDLFSQSDVQKLLVILRAVCGYGNDVHLVPLLHVSLFGIDPLDMYKFLQTVSLTKEYSVYDYLSEQRLLEKMGLPTKDSPLVALGGKLKRWVHESHEKDLMTFFEYIVRDSGLLENIITHGNSIERLDALNALFDEVRSIVEINAQATLTDFFAYIDTIKKHNLFLRRHRGRSAGNAVHLMTVHRAKGLEFAHVYIIRVVNGVFGGKIERERLPLIESVYKI